MGLNDRRLDRIEEQLEELLGEGAPPRPWAVAADGMVRFGDEELTAEEFQVRHPDAYIFTLVFSRMVVEDLEL